jgi:hypothetical protein
VLCRLALVNDFEWKLSTFRPVAGRSVRVAINKKRTAFLLQARCQVYGGGCFANPALETCNGDYQNDLDF